LQRVDCAIIDMVQAEGDYMRVHSGSQSWLLHATLRGVFRKLTPGEFVCVHRSLIVRCAYIERMLHEGRRWVACLQSGEQKKVARSHVRDVLQALGIDSANVRQASPRKAKGARVGSSNSRVKEATLSSG
jgi:two-component system response regulator AlgR